MEEEIPLDDIPPEEAIPVTGKAKKRAPAFYEEGEGFKPFGPSSSAADDTQS